MELREKEWFIEAPWGRICIVAWGSCEDPPVLVCHGDNDSMASFRPLMRQLPRSFYYVGVEWPGNGRSDRYPPGLMVTVLDLVYVIEVVRAHFRWDRFVYLAHSLATTIGKLYNLSYPGYMSKVIELDPITPSFVTAPEKFVTWYNRYFSYHYDNYERLNSPKENGPKYTWEEAIAKVVKARGLSSETARAIVERMSEPAGDGLIRFTFDQRMKRLSRPPFDSKQIHSLFTSITTPTLVIAANDSIQKGLYIDTPFLLEESAFQGNFVVRKVDGRHDVHVLSAETVAPYVSQFLLYGIKGVKRGAKL